MVSVALTFLLFVSQQGTHNGHGSLEKDDLFLFARALLGQECYEDFSQCNYVNVRMLQPFIHTVSSFATIKRSDASVARLSNPKIRIRWMGIKIMTSQLTSF